MTLRVVALKAGREPKFLINKYPVSLGHLAGEIVPGVKPERNGLLVGADITVVLRQLPGIALEKVKKVFQVELAQFLACGGFKKRVVCGKTVKDGREGLEWTRYEVLFPVNIENGDPAVRLAEIHPEPIRLEKIEFEDIALKFNT